MILVKPYVKLHCAHDWKQTCELFYQVLIFTISYPSSTYQLPNNAAESASQNAVTALMCSESETA